VLEGTDMISHAVWSLTVIRYPSIDFFRREKKASPELVARDFTLRSELVDGRFGEACEGNNLVDREEPGGHGVAPCHAYRTAAHDVWS